MIENTNDPKGNKRSPFTVSGKELITAIISGLVTWFGLMKFLQTAKPYYCQGVTIDSPCSDAYVWESMGSHLFSMYSIPITLFLVLSSIFIVRAIQRDVLHFSVLGNMSMSWPLFSLLGFITINVFSLCLFPTGLALSIIVMIHSSEEKRFKLDWISFPYNLAWLIVLVPFVNRFLALYGD